MNKKSWIMVLLLLITILMIASIHGGIVSCSDDNDNDDPAITPTPTGTMVPPSPTATVTPTPHDGEPFYATFGGSRDDWGNYAEETSDGGFIISGETYSYGEGSYDIYVIKTDERGQEVWSRTFGGKETDYGIAVHQVEDDGYLIAGSGSYGIPDYGVYLLKLDSSGNEEWIQALEIDGFSFLNDMIITDDKGTVVIGHRLSDAYVAKTDSSGSVLWQKRYDGYQAYCVQQLANSGYIISGSYLDSAALYALDENGVMLWTQTYNDELESLRSVQVNDDGSIVAVGHQRSVYGPFFSSLIKTDAQGEVLWEKTFNESGCGYQKTYGLFTDRFGGYVAATTCFYSWDSYPREVILTRFDSNANIVWSIDTPLIVAESVNGTSDDGFVICGTGGSLANNDAGLLKTDFYGNTE